MITGILNNYVRVFGEVRDVLSAANGQINGLSSLYIFDPTVGPRRRA